MSFEPSKRRHSGEVEGEPLNLIPIMNLLTILIPFLTLSAVFMKLSVLPTTLPSISDAPAAEQPEKQEEDDKPDLNLTVSITPNGFDVAGTGGVLGGTGGEGPTVPLTDEDAYDYDALTAKLMEIKKKYPHEKDVILVPEMSVKKDDEKHEIEYQVIIDTMDAVRRAPEPVADSDEDGELDNVLFPGVIFSPGIL